MAPPLLLRPLFSSSRQLTARAHLPSWWFPVRLLGLPVSSPRLPAWLPVPRRAAPAHLAAAVARELYGFSKWPDTP